MVGGWGRSLRAHRYNTVEIFLRAPKKSSFDDLCGFKTKRTVGTIQKTFQRREEA